MAAGWLMAARSAVVAAGPRGQGEMAGSGLAPVAGRQGPCRLRRPVSPSLWLGKVELVLAHRWLARVHPITDSNTPGPRSAPLRRRAGIG